MANVVRPSAPSMPRKVPSLVASRTPSMTNQSSCSRRPVTRLEDELQMIEPEAAPGRSICTGTHSMRTLANLSSPGIFPAGA